MKHLRTFESYDDKYTTMDFTFTGVPTDGELIETFINLIDENINVNCRRTLDFAVALKGSSRTIHPVINTWTYYITSSEVVDITKHESTSVDEDAKMIGFVDRFEVFSDKEMNEALVKNAIKKLRSLDTVANVKSKRHVSAYYTLTVTYKDPSYTIGV